MEEGLQKMNTPDIKCELLITAEKGCFHRVQKMLDSKSIVAPETAFSNDDEVCWLLFDTGYVKSWSVEEVVRLLLDKASGVIQCIDLLCNEKVKTIVEVTVYHYDAYPEMHLDREIIGSFNKMRAEVDFDLY